MGIWGLCVFLCMGLVFVFGDVPTFCFFRWKSSGGFLQLGNLRLRPDSPRYGSAAEFAKIIDGVTEAEVPTMRRRGGRFPTGFVRDEVLGMSQEASN